MNLLFPSSACHFDSLCLSIQTSTVLLLTTSMSNNLRLATYSKHPTCTLVLMPSLMILSIQVFPKENISVLPPVLHLVFLIRLQLWGTAGYPITKELDSHLSQSLTYSSLPQYPVMSEILISWHHQCVCTKHENIPLHVECPSNGALL